MKTIDETIDDYRDKSNEPKVGEPIFYRGEPAGTVHHLDGNICYFIPPDGNFDKDKHCFIWRFREGLNTLHDWLSKKNKEAK